MLISHLVGLPIERTEGDLCIEAQKQCGRKDLRIGYTTFGFDEIDGGIVVLGTEWRGGMREGPRMTI